MSNETVRPNFVAKEWNNSGSTFFYGSKKQRTYIVEVTLSGSIDGETLQKSIDKALVRLPYYKNTFVRIKGLYYYAENDLPLLAAESETPRIVGGESTNYHYIDVTYWKDKITFAMFHGLCDGLGFNRFIEAVLYHYFCIKDGKEYGSDGIYTEAVPYDPAEETDPYDKPSEVSNEEIKQIANGEKRYHLPEIDESTDDCMYSYPLKIKTEDFIAWCKANSTSPAAGISAIMTKAVSRINDVKPEDGAIMSVLPFSMRNFLGYEKTYKNCSTAVFIKASAEDAANLSVGEIAANLRTLMKTQLNEHIALALTGGMQMVINLGKKAPFYKLKNKLFALPERRPQDSFFIDYVGGLKADGYADQITDVRYLNVNVSTGICSVVLSETAGYFHINLTQSFASDKYFKGITEVLDELKLGYEVIPCFTFLNPEVILPGEQKN